MKGCTLKSWCCSQSWGSRSMAFNWGGMCVCVWLHSQGLAGTRDVCTCHSTGRGTAIGRRWQRQDATKECTMQKTVSHGKTHPEHEQCQDWGILNEYGNDTVSKMFRATSGLFPSEYLCSSRLSWSFYSGHSHEPHRSSKEVLQLPISLQYPCISWCDLEGSFAQSTL